MNFIFTPLGYFLMVRLKRIGGLVLISDRMVFSKIAAINCPLSKNVTIFQIKHWELDLPYFF